MPKTPALTPKELIHILQENGFVLDRVKGSHHIFLHSELKKRVVIPMHKKDLPIGTLFKHSQASGY